MKHCIIILMFTFAIYGQTKFTYLSNPYPGQKVPVSKAEIFFPELVSSSDKEHGKLTIAPDWKTIYWDYIKLPFTGGNVQRTAYITENNDKWSGRQIAEFSGGEYQTWSPCFRGNDKIVFGKKKDVGTDSVKLVSDFWVTRKTTNGWQEAEALGFDKFTETLKWTFSIANNGNIYFDDRNYEQGQYGWGMYVSKFKNGEYTKPVMLPEHLNTKDFDWTPFISPDESFLLFASNRLGSMGSTDIYVSFRSEDGSWSEAINLGEKVNSENVERWPSLSPDGRILFFQRDYVVDDTLKEQDYYWIDAKIIEDLRP